MTPRTVSSYHGGVGSSYLDSYASRGPMEFIEMTGKSLLRVVRDDGPTPAELAAVGVAEDSIVRVNRQGDIELRREDRWDIIGGLLGEFEIRIKRETGLDWA